MPLAKSVKLIDFPQISRPWKNPRKSFWSLKFQEMHHVDVKNTGTMI